METIALKLAFPAVAGVLGVLYALLTSQVRDNRKDIRHLASDHDEKFERIQQHILDIKVDIAAIKTELRRNNQNGKYKIKE